MPFKTLDEGWFFRVWCQMPNIWHLTHGNALKNLSIQLVKKRNKHVSKKKPSFNAPQKPQAQIYH